MRVTLLLIVFSLVYMSASAQITIDQSNMPSAGGSFPFRLLATLPTGLDPSMTGEGMVWDYNDLSLGLSEADTFYSVGSTPFAYQFFFNNQLVYPSYNANYAKKDIDVDLGLVALENTYVFYKNNGQGLRNVGYGAEVNGIPTPVQNDPIDYIYEFPLEYQDSFESASSSEVDIPFVGYFQRNLERSTEVEGYGTLILPSGEFEVLKVKVILNASDSIYIVDFGTGFTINQPEETIYQWLALEHVQPVLQISQQVGFGYTVQYYEELPIGLEESISDAITYFPNPTNDALFLSVQLGRPLLYELKDIQSGTIYSGMIGEEVGTVQLEMKNLNSGIYFLFIKEQDGQILKVEKVIKD